MSSPLVPHPDSNRELGRDLDLDLSFATSLNGSILTLEDELADVSDNPFTDAGIDHKEGNGQEDGDGDQAAEEPQDKDKASTTSESSLPTGYRRQTESFVKLNQEALEKWRGDLEVIIQSLRPTESEAEMEGLSTTLQLFDHALGIYDWIRHSVGPYIAVLEARQEAVQREMERRDREIDLLRDEAEEVLKAYSTEYETSRRKTSMLGEFIDIIDVIAEGNVSENEGRAEEHQLGDVGPH
ncbi:hypothetical protein A1O3_04974 [Capronia epimyces CBS 606.96]|uniref:Uncharacterized protein n=1 Tax=Capronia epimyces CBS 606.96 TaxID=1182542 RepID=W9XUS1_9EURO|nr:uncharacterized protein A1O3_04974 [Capronia epimyces CBS 606.96]EXJ84307.1 hypothetical protein A1O3_04974 [Capronia epimyces CBS 606.96]